MTRATHHLFRGDISQALRFNLFVVAVLAAIAAAWVVWLAQASGRSVGWVRRVPVWAQVLAGTGLVAYAVVRNLPGVDGMRG